MADLEEIKERIAELGGRRRNVSLAEIEWVLNQLSEHYPVKIRRATHGILYRIGGLRFMVSGHNPGNRQVKPCYVDEFCAKMEELGLYES